MLVKYRVEAPCLILVAIYTIFNVLRSISREVICES